MEHKPLSPREHEIALLIAKRALCNKSIARELGLSECTVKTVVRHILLKLGTARRTSIVIAYHEGKLL